MTAEERAAEVVERWAPQCGRYYLRLEERIAEAIRAAVAEALAARLRVEITPAQTLRGQGATVELVTLPEPGRGEK